MLVTGLTYDSSGNLTQIEITEQTPPQLKRSYYTPSTIGSKYGAYYTIQRYTGYVPGNQPDGYSLVLYKDQYITTSLCTAKYDEIRLVVQWIPKDTDAQTYTVEYNGNGAEGTMAATEVTYGTSTKLRTNTFTKDGYNFAGWRAHRRSDDKWLFKDANGVLQTAYSDMVAVDKI